MVAVADVFRRFAPSYQAAHGAAMPPSHRRAIADILACRTEALGGHPSAAPRAAPRSIAAIPAATGAARNAMANRPGPGWTSVRPRCWHPFHVTVTVPEELRAALRRHQRDGYGALMTATAEAIVELARDRRHVGGTVGVLAVLHTWTQQLHFHHVHCLVTGGGVGEDGDTWHPARSGFLVPTKALARKVRGRFRAVFERCPG